jgi:hypothetical protein
MEDTTYVDSTPKQYQIQKVYIKRLEETELPEILESDLMTHFSDFGTVIDVKTLRNCKLRSKKRTLRVRDLSRRGVRNRGPEHPQRLQEPERELRRSH